MTKTEIQRLPGVKLGLAYILQNSVSGHYLAGSPYYPYATMHLMVAKTWYTQRSIKAWMTQFEGMLKPDQQINIFSPVLGWSKKIPRDSIEKYNILCLDQEGKVIHTVGTGALRQHLIKLPY